MADGRGALAPARVEEGAEPVGRQDGGPGDGGSRRRGVAVGGDRATRGAGAAGTVGWGGGGPLGVPVGGVLRVLRRAEIGRLVGGEPVEGYGGPGRRGPAALEGLVQLGEPPQMEVLAEAVQNDVVVAEVQQGPLGPEQEQFVRAGVLPGEVGHRGQVGPYPRVGDGLRIRLVAEFGDGENGQGRRHEGTAGPVGRHVEAGPERLRLTERARHGAVQGEPVEGTGEGEGDPALVERDRGGVPLALPDPVLRGGEVPGAPPGPGRGRGRGGG